MDSTSAIPMLEAPRGMHGARLDDRGRIKLPTDFAKWVEAFREKKVFVTSLDRKTARIYPMATWRENEAVFAKFTSDPRVSRNVAFTANQLGGEAEMDTQGRIVFPQELRRTLGIEDRPVYVYVTNGKIEVLSEEIYKAREAEAAASPEADLSKMEEAGLR